MPWADGVVRYYNAAPSQAWALGQAVTAWNRSGAKVRFVATSRQDAQLIIRHDRSVASCRRAEATVGYVDDARVLIYRAAPGSGCNRYAAAWFLAHEFGHVLGLEHENGGCAVMNSSGNYMGGKMCERAHPWEWRCQLLEQDDVRGAVAIYGGTVKLQKRSSPLCPLYDSIAPPRAVTASYMSVSRGVVLQFRPASEPAMPGFLASMAEGRLRGFAYLRHEDDCPSPSMFAAAIRPPPVVGTDPEWLLAPRRPTAVR